MNGKIFSATAFAALTGIAIVALGSRQAADPATSASQPVSPNVETVVVQRTEHIRKRIKRKQASSGRNTRAAVAATAPYRYATAPVEVGRPAAPRVHTSPSATGSDESEHESEDGYEHESDRYESREGDDGAERDD